LTAPACLAPAPRTPQMLVNPLPLYSDADAIDICLQIARGLAYMHGSRPMVIHRDLKLENILLAGEGGASGGGREGGPAPGGGLGLGQCLVGSACTRPPARALTTHPPAHASAEKSLDDGKFTVKIADFGLSRCVSVKKQQALFQRARTGLTPVLTAPGDALASAGSFIAPTSPTSPTSPASPADTRRRLSSAASAPHVLE